MGFFDRLRKGGEAKGQEDDGAAAAWDNLKKVPFAGDAQSNQAAEQALDDELKLAEGQRQQAKIVRGMLNGAAAGLSTRSVQLEPGERSVFLSKMVSGEIGREEERGFLRKIGDPVTLEGAENVFRGGVQGDKHRSRILAQMTGLGFDNWQKVDTTNLRVFIERYPLPMDFDEPGQKFLGTIQRQNPESKYLEYVQAMKEFKSQVYGKRQEYWEQMQKLEQEAREQTETLTEPVMRGETKMTATKELAMRHLGEQEQRELLVQTQIDGDLWIQQGKSYRLTPEMLEGVGLAPEYEVDLEGVKIGLSGIFNDCGREAAMAYVQTEKGVDLRSYYRSSSQGLWRLLPDYVAGEGQIAWFGKGYSEESLTLPIELQRALTKVRRESGVKSIRLNPDFVLAGAAKRYASKGEYREALTENRLRGTVYEEVAHTPKVKLGGLRLGEKAPEMVVIAPELAPDFGEEAREWETEMPLYGKVKVREFDSRNDELRYMFCQDQDGRAWVGSVETKAKITSTGLRSEWVKAGEITTPLYEYEVQDGGYGDKTDRRRGYVSMWPRYLSKVPVIADFVAREER